LACAHAASGQVLTLNQTVNVRLQPAGKLSAPATVVLPSAGVFSPFAGGMNLNYKTRTTNQIGSAAITLQSLGEISPSGGPTLAAGSLTYSCGTAQVGTGCAGAQVVSAAQQRKVVDIPAGVCMGGSAPCSASNPSSIPLQFSMDNNPGYDPGSYNVRLLFTISSL
jgi:hypothetical protein